MPDNRLELLDVTWLRIFEFPDVSWLNTFVFPDANWLNMSVFPEVNWLNRFVFPEVNWLKRFEFPVVNWLNMFVWFVRSAVAALITGALAPPVMVLKALAGLVKMEVGLLATLRTFVGAVITVESVEPTIGIFDAPIARVPVTGAVTCAATDIGAVAVFIIALAELPICFFL
jgi:hypothetical protein